MKIGLVLFLGTCICLAVTGAAAQIQTDAYKKFNSFIQSSSNDDSTKEFKKGRDFIESGKWRDAEEVFASFANRFPQNRNLDAALYWQAVAARKLADYSRAEELCNKLLADFPKSNWSRDARVLQMEMAPFVGDIDRLTSQVDALVAEAGPLALLDVQLDNSDLQGNTIPPPAARFGRMSEQDEIKSIALQSLIRSNPEKALPYLTNILGKDSKASPNLKSHALVLLGQLKNEKATSLLMDVARSDADPRMKRSALGALGSTSDERVVDFLAEQAVRADDVDTSRTAIMALARLRSERAREAVLRIARTGVNSNIRRSAISSLGSRMDDALAQQLLTILDNEKDAAVQKQIVSVLGRSRNPAVEAKLGELVRSGASEEVRSAAIQAVSRRTDDNVVDELTKAYRAESSQKVKAAIISSLSRMAVGDSGLWFEGINSDFRLRYMEEAMEGANRAAKAALDSALVTDTPVASARSQTAAPRPVIPRSPSVPGSSDLAAPIAHAGLIRGPLADRKPNEKAFKALLSLFDSESNEQLRGQYLVAFGRSENKEGLKKLLHVAKSDSSVELRKQAVVLIGRSKDPEAVKFMEDLLK